MYELTAIRLIRRPVPQQSHRLYEFIHISIHVMLREYSKSLAYGRIIVGELGETLGFLNINVSLQAIVKH